MQTITLSFYRFGTVPDMVWVFTQMLAARAPLRRIPELGFFKLMGSGSRAGFHPYPNFAVWSVLATWPSLDAAQRHLSDAPVFQRFRAHAVEDCTFYMTPERTRGAWSGIAPFSVSDEDPVDGTGATAVLTRATIRPRHMLSFWSRVPNISETAVQNDQMDFKIGLGEIPWFHQVTFSIWRSESAIRDFAFSKWHGDAVTAVNRHGWFSEQLFARFHVLRAEGQWEGRAPLATLEEAA